MNRRLGAVAIVLMALTALIAVCSFVFFSQPVPKDSATTPDSSSTSTSTSTSSSPETINADPSEPPPIPNSLPLVTAAPRPDQPPKLKPQPPSRSPDWKLLDWSLKPLPEKSGVQLRASSYLASGKYPFVRVEEEIRILPNGGIKTLTHVEMVGDQIIVKLPAGSPSDQIRSLAAKLGGQAAAKPFAPDTWLVALPRKLEAVPEALAGSTNSGITIDYAEPNHLVRSLATPNDPLYGNQWHLPKISAPAAWDFRSSATNIIVAVIDTGVRYDHEDLSTNMWINPGEIAGNGLDDDQNGFVDDVFGADEFSNDGNPMDENGHGTHCAGLIGAVGNNSKGVSGVCWNGVAIMALRFLGTNGEGSRADAIASIDYAIAKGAKIINASYGGQGFSNAENSAMQRAFSAGIIIVAAAGNNGTNNDLTPFYPASYSRSNIIAVGATDQNDARAGFSNIGQVSVDLMAPGVTMWSTALSSSSPYGQGQGTSFAAPVVTGAVALLRASYPGDSLSQLRAKILAGVDVLPGLAGLCATGGRLNLAKIVPAVPPTALATIWHRPAYPEPLISSNTMRLPAYEVALGGAFTVYSGLRKFNNPNYGTANQTGGYLFYRTSSASSWLSNALAHHSDNGDYQFWSAAVPGTATTNTVQYYLRLNFNSGVEPVCYLYGSDNQSRVTTDESAARAQPFSLRDRVSWVFHSPVDRTIDANSAKIRAKVGYIAPDGISFRGATAGTLYYTLDGNFPAGSMGNPGNGSTLTTPFQFLSAQSDPSQAGEAMVWEAVMTNLPVGTSINYILGFWNENTMEEQQAGYQSPGSLTKGEFLIPWSFRAVYPDSLPASDANGDGVPALVEYALGGSSQSNNLGVLPTMTISNHMVKLEAMVRTNDPNLQIYPQAAFDLASSNAWTTNAIFITNTSTNGTSPGFVRRTYEFNADTNLRAFLKLTIQQ